jgi:hypothetical protein
MPKSSLPARPQHGNGPTEPPTEDSRPLLERILDTPQLARVVPRLPADVLHRIIQRVGLEDSGELLALTTPEQTARVFDLDLWRPDQPGLDEHFDADRFGLWLEVLMESGATVAANKIAEVDADLATAAFAQHVLVFDPAAVLPGAQSDDELPDASTPHAGLSYDIGGYRIVGTRADSWDAVVGVLSSLSADHHDYFDRVMRGCRTLSNSGHELDGLDALLAGRDQNLFDLAFTRERRREQQGFVTPAQARAFLQMARQLPLGKKAMPPSNPVAQAYFRAIEWTNTAPADTEDSAAAVVAIVGLLQDAGILPQQSRALLDGPQGAAPRLARIRALMQLAGDHHPAAFLMRTQELAFLANTMIAGCSIQARPFTEQEASDAAVATCNLGLEHWPTHWIAANAGTALPDDFLVEQDLVGVFQVGWAVLHNEVCIYAAKQLIGVLKHVQCADRETRAGLHALRMEMTKKVKAGTPWEARDALDVITILDMPAWATLLGLIDECPVLHAGIGASQGSRAHAVSASAFEFISEDSQIASVHAFMESLPETLRP